MANLYPTALNNYTGAETDSAAGHAQEHNALEAKLGTGASTPANNTVLRGNGAGSSAYAQVNLTTDVSNNLPIQSGGTNTSSLPTGLLVGAGTGAITAKTAPSGAIVGDTDTQTLSGKTLTSPKANQILDTNGNPTVIFTANASAVNGLTFDNAATTFYPVVKSTGNDTNIDIGLKGKGTGVARLGNSGLAFPNSDGSAGQVIKTDGAGNLSFTSSAIDGWTSDTDTWVWVSGNSFKVAGKDVTARFRKGTFVKCTNNATTFYATVASSAFSTDTTITLMVSSDYTLANSAITAPFYSYQAAPQGFPTWFNFTSTLTGFSGSPITNIRYSVVGAQIWINTVTSSGTLGGTSNLATFNFSLPVAPNLGGSVVLPQICAAMDNGVWLSAGGNSPSVVGFTDASTTAKVGVNIGTVAANAYGSFTASGTKAVGGMFTYQF